MSSVFTYLVRVRVGGVGPDWVDSDVYINMYGEQGQTGRRLLKHSLSNPTKLQENQVKNLFLYTLYMFSLC